MVMIKITNIVQIIPAGPNRECFALTELGQVYLLVYNNTECVKKYEWIEMPDLEDD